MKYFSKPRSFIKLIGETMLETNFRYVLLCALCMAPCFFSCNNSTNPNPVVYTTLTVVKPSAGEIIKAGSTYTVQWGYPQNWQYTQVRVIASVSNRGLFVGKDITTPINYPQNTFQWSVPPDTSGDSCEIEVLEYNENERSFSGYFKITN